MFRTITVLWLVALAVLALFGLSSSASATESRLPDVMVFPVVEKNRTADVRYDMLGHGPMVVRIYLTKLDKAFQLQPRTSKYQTLKKRLVINQADGNIVLPAGTRYWVYGKTNTGYWRQRIHAVVKVRENIRMTNPDGTAHELCLTMFLRATGKTWQSKAAPTNYCEIAQKWVRSS